MKSVNLETQIIKAIQAERVNQSSDETTNRIDVDEQIKVQLAIAMIGTDATYEACMVKVAALAMAAIEALP